MARTRIELHEMLCDLEQELRAIQPHVTDGELMDFFSGQARAIEEGTPTPDDLLHVRKRLRRILVGQGLLAA